MSSCTAIDPHETREHWLASKIVAQTFRITVQKPMSRGDGSERFPVLYVTDSDHFWGGLSDLANALQVSGETPRFILVGIGYGNAHAAALLRTRDLYTHAVRRRFRAEIERYARSPLGEGADSVQAIMQTTDAEGFLSFIRQELIPFIGARYAVLPSDNSYFGYSAGGAFGLYTLFSEPGTFKRYILGSPATSHDDDDYAIEFVEEFRRSGKPIDARVFASVGGLEGPDRGPGTYDLVTGFNRLVRHLRHAAIPGLDLTVQSFPGETHATAWTLAFSHGLKTLFGPVEHVPFWSEFFE